MCSQLPEPLTPPLPKGPCTTDPVQTFAAQLPSSDAEKPQEPDRKTRRKLWDIDEKYHCPIIGTCLHVDELRRVARNTGSVSPRKLDDYEVHVSFVVVADQKHTLSIGIQKLLEKKHAGALREFSRAKDVEQIRLLWCEAVETGRVPGAFWALMTHPKTDSELAIMAYEEVHMLSHQVGAGLITDARLLTETRNELAIQRRDARQEARRTKAALAQRDKRIAHLEERLSRSAASDAALTETQEKIALLESGAELRRLRDRIASLEEELFAAKRSENRARREADELREERAASQTELEQTSALLSDYEAACGVMERVLSNGTQDSCESCTSEQCSDCLDLAGRRVLCVGGRSSLASHYRSLVNRFNGEFVHHDGGIEDSRQRLESLLATADVVICPANYVSHDAYLRAKRFCKRNDKAYVLLKSAGVASFARALEQVAT